jgi:hypothetical protein
MAVKKPKSTMTCIVIGSIIGIIAGAFLPDSLSPMVLIKKITSKSK